MVITLCKSKTEHYVTEHELNTMELNTERMARPVDKGPLHSDRYFLLMDW